ncbi:GPP34 family phosphoprotein [Nonomuraea insulae]|uniref:GPP34 family phosphoprotein n=1 Tax=Nonomuraea insulae TaxID=1616787 RepID=A0ABW1CIC2_9ACTN
MKQDESLTRSAFLLAIDLRKERLANRSELGYLLRAAALTELLLAGNLADESGKARAVSAPAGAEPGSLPAIVWEQISNSPPRSWQRWIRKDQGKAIRLVRDELAAAQVIRVERRRVLIFHVDRIKPRKAYLTRKLAERVGRAIRGGQPVSRLELDARVLAALAAAAQTVLPARWETYQRRDRIEQLSAPIEPVATALRKAVQSAKSAAASG